VDVIGLNYDFEGCLDAHRRYPDKGIMFSEFCACGTTRGWYDETDPTRGYVTTYDHHTDHYFVSRDMNYTFLRNNPFMMGGFAWNAFEYRGESVYPRLGSCSGLLDLYLQKKDSYYYTAALVSKKPVLHILPHWNYQGLEGMPITVIAYTNALEAQLFVNGKALETHAVNQTGYAQWEVPYESGEIKVVATFADGTVLIESKHTTSAPVSLRLTVEECANAPEEIALVTCNFFDADGREVPTASNAVSFNCRGDGFIYATGADPSDHSSPYLHDRKAFSGTITVAVKRTGDGPIYLTARSEGLLSCYTEL
jgi:beta-galactosidase